MDLYLENSQADLVCSILKKYTIKNRNAWRILLESKPREAMAVLSVDSDAGFEWTYPQSLVPGVETIPGHGTVHVCIENEDLFKKINKISSQKEMEIFLIRLKIFG